MEQAISPSAKWSPGTLIAFRFFFVYAILYAIPFPFQLISGGTTFFQPAREFFFHGYQWIARNFMGLELFLADPNGSGDTTFNYVQVCVFTFVSLLITAVWSIVDRKKSEYEKLHYWLIVFLRYYLAFVLMGYGFAKVFKTQFPFPSTYHLYQPLGDFSPMGLLWTFMGYSTVYNIFTGLAEVIGGFLLFFKRTRLIGALIGMAVMSHIVILNFAYDVPVKLFSSHLLVFIIVVMLPDLKRLLNFFLLNKPVAPESIAPVYQNQRTRVMYLIGKGGLIILLIGVLSAKSVENRKLLKEYYAAETEPLLGNYNVETFILNGEVVTPGMRDTQRWKKIAIKGRSMMSIQYMDGGTGPWQFNKNPSNTRIIIHSNDLTSTGVFTTRSDGAILTLEGTLDQNNLKIICKKDPAALNDSFLLVSRGFHWVNEFPFNR